MSNINPPANLDKQNLTRHARQIWWAYTVCVIPRDSYNRRWDYWHLLLKGDKIQEEHWRMYTHMQSASEQIELKTSRFEIKGLFPSYLWISWHSKQLFHFDNRIIKLHTFQTYAIFDIIVSRSLRHYSRNPAHRYPSLESGKSSPV